MTPARKNPLASDDTPVSKQFSHRSNAAKIRALSPLFLPSDGGRRWDPHNNAEKTNLLRDKASCGKSEYLIVLEVRLVSGKRDTRRG
jgi:hypothetical protein